MSWSKLAPIVKSSGRPMASASIVVHKDGVPKVSLILSASLKDEFAAYPKVEVSAGEGEHEGSVLLEFGEAGDFELRNFVHGGGRVFFPLGAGLPEKPAGNEACRLGEKTATSVVIHLPVAAWNEQIGTRIKPPAARPAIVGNAQPPVAKVGNGQSLDMAEYLRGKGLKVQRLAENRFQIDGQVMIVGQVLKLVNDHRKAADLDPLPLHRVW